MNKAKILGIDYVLPQKIITNSELQQKNPSWNMHDLECKTQIYSRHVAGEDETALDLAKLACEKLFARLNYPKENIDGVIFCTQTPSYILPGDSSLLQHALGLSKNIFAIDIKFGCAGYVNALHMGSAFIASGMANNILIITSETITKHLSYSDRSTATVFGDAGAATLLVSDEVGIDSFDIGTDGSGAKDVYIPAGGSLLKETPDTKILKKDNFENERSLEHLKMDGAKVLNYVKKNIPTSVRKLLNESNLNVNEIDLYFIHQGTGIVIDFIQLMLGLPKNKVYKNLGNIGNTSSASIPVALRDAEIEGKLIRGDKIMLISFGAGYTRAACILNW